MADSHQLKKMSRPTVFVFWNNVNFWYDPVLQKILQANDRLIQIAQWYVYHICIELIVL